MRKHAYRLLSAQPAKKKAKKLVGIAKLVGLDVKLSRSQEIVARLMGYDDWADLLRWVKDRPQEGVSDQLLPPAASKARERYQLAILSNEFGIDEFPEASSILEALAPTGGTEGKNWPSVKKLGLRLTEEDDVWLQEAMALVRQFDIAARFLYGIVPANRALEASHPLTHIKFQRITGKRFRVKTDTSPGHVVEWVAMGCAVGEPLTQEQREEVGCRAEEAHEAFRKLDVMIRNLGSAPMMAPIDWTFLMLYRQATSRGDKKYFSAVCPEPWLHIGFDLPGFTFCPENEWGASRALPLQLGLRREFLDAGWTESGSEWRVTFRDGNSAKEEIVVRADTAGEAVAWCVAARAALRLVKGQTVSLISLLSVSGPNGIADRNQALFEAKAHPIIRRGKLVDSGRLRIRGKEKASYADRSRGANQWITKFLRRSIAPATKMSLTGRPTRCRRLSGLSPKSGYTLQISGRGWRKPSRWP